MGITTLGAERATNPFLAALADERALQGPARHLRRAAGSAPRAGERRRRPRREAFAGAGYGRIETPIFEDTELFARGVGEAPTSSARRCSASPTRADAARRCGPEGTAPICRAYLEHGMHKLPQPVKLWYWGPFFRHERPQAGRYRQFHQIGAEVIGSDSPLVDAELIVLLDDLLHDLGCRRAPAPREPRHAGGARRLPRASSRPTCASTRPSSREDVRERIDENPLRAFDSKDEGTRGGDGRRADDARPPDAEDARALRRGARGCSTRAGVHYELDGTLVRGLDYYTRTVFAFECDDLGAQSEVAGGGRYDGLIELLGGPRRPASAGPRHRAGPAGARPARPRAPGRGLRRRRTRAARARARGSSPSCAAPGLRADLDLAGRRSRAR